MIEKLIDKNTSQEKERQKAKKHNKESLTQLSSSSKNQKKTLQEELWRQNITTTLRQEQRSWYWSPRRTQGRSPRRTRTRRPLTTKGSRPKVKTKGGIQQQENEKITHRRMTRGTSSSSSVSTKATIAPAEQRTKVLG